MRLILIGPPGAGKGVLAERLVQHFQIAPLSTGDLFREAIQKETPLGKEVEKYLQQGELVPDEIVERAVQEKLKETGFARGFLLDGFPRTVHQAQMLDCFLEEQKCKIDFVIQMEVPEEVIIRRLTSRRVCSRCQAIYNLVTMKPKQEGICDSCQGELVQRPDDTEAVIRERLEVFKKQTAPVLDYYQKKGGVLVVDSSKDIEYTIEQVLTKIP